MCILILVYKELIIEFMNRNIILIITVFILFNNQSDKVMDSGCAIMQKLIIMSKINFLKLKESNLKNYWNLEIAIIFHILDTL